MIATISKIAMSMPTPIKFLHLLSTPTQSMSLLTQKLTQRQSKKSQQQFKKQIEYMANKPTFTYMDYKQRVTDQLNNLKSSIRKNMSREAKDAEKSLTIQKKILSAMYEEELVGDKEVYHEAKKEISIVSEVPIEKVRETFKKAESYKKMHKYLREKHLRGQPLPESMNELQYQFRNSRHQLTGRERLFLRLKQDRSNNPGFMRAVRSRYMKFNK